MATRLRQAVIDWGLTMTLDRLSEKDAARLLGVSRDYLKTMRELGTGPKFFRRPVGGSRISYAVDDLALWLVER
jgi:hypothetical protein